MGAVASGRVVGRVWAAAADGAGRAGLSVAGAGWLEWIQGRRERFGLERGNGGA
jgi:hypothetical protein